MKNYENYVFFYISVMKNDHYFCKMLPQSLFNITVSQDLKKNEDLSEIYLRPLF